MRQGEREGGGERDRARERTTEGREREFVCVRERERQTERLTDRKTDT